MWQQLRRATIGRVTAPEGTISSLGEVREVQPKDGSGAHLVEGDVEGFSRTHKLSIDAALFPCLHPGGKGAFRPATASRDSGRSASNSSPHSLMQEDLLQMFHERRIMCAATRMLTHYG